MNRNRKAVWGWALYDWANSAFATTVMAGFFPVFFKTYWCHGVDAVTSTARLGFGNSLASICVALLSPVLGAVADRGSARKRFLMMFTYLGVLSTALLYLVREGHWRFALAAYAFGAIGFSGANTFYDSLLPGITNHRNMDFVSSLGYSLGYLGGGVLFLINVLMTQMPSTFGFADTAHAVRFAFLSVAVWWGGFTLVTMAWVPEGTPASPAATARERIAQGLAQLATTFRHLRHMRPVLVFLLAYWCYIDGVDTIMRMAVDYGMALGFSPGDLIKALLIVQFVGFPAALLTGLAAGTWKIRTVLFGCIGMYLLVTLWGVTMTHTREFYLLAVMIGCVQGGVQALSRSYYCRLIPANHAAQFYGFYNMLGRFSAIAGPALMACVGLAVKHLLLPASPTAEQMHHAGTLASRAGLASVAVLFAAGAVLLGCVDEKRAGDEAAFLSRL